VVGTAGRGGAGARAGRGLVLVASGVTAAATDALSLGRNGLCCAAEVEAARGGAEVPPGPVERVSVWARAGGAGAAADSTAAAAAGAGGATRRALRGSVAALVVDDEDGTERIAGRAAQPSGPALPAAAIDDDDDIVVEDAPPALGAVGLKPERDGGPTTAAPERAELVDAASGSRSSQREAERDDEGIVEALAEREWSTRAARREGAAPCPSDSAADVEVEAEAARACERGAAALVECETVERDGPCDVAIEGGPCDLARAGAAGRVGAWCEDGPVEAPSAGAGLRGGGRETAPVEDPPGMASVTLRYSRIVGVMGAVNLQADGRQDRARASREGRGRRTHEETRSGHSRL